MISAEITKNYKKSFKGNPMSRARDLKAMVKKDHNCNTTMSTCIRARAMALRSMINDYKEQFRQL